MDHGIWAIWYDVPDAHKTEYLDWFHHVHIPDKLARPGYVWAAHYALGGGTTDAGYLALFGGVTEPRPVADTPERANAALHRDAPALSRLYPR